MSILPLISFALLAMVLMSMLAKTRPYSKTVLPGKTLMVTRMSLLSKLWMHRFGLAALISGLVFTSLAGWLPLNMVYMVAAFALVILLMPMKMTFTTQGLALGDGIYRPWKEFSGVKQNKTSLELQNKSMFAKVVLFINPTKNQQTLKLIENHIPATLPNG
ncbi:MAG: hypothetical protein ACYDH2_07515 [Anaerolineaceae bacterium]